MEAFALLPLIIATIPGGIFFLPVTFMFISV